MQLTSIFYLLVICHVYFKLRNLNWKLCLQSFWILLLKFLLRTRPSPVHCRNYDDVMQGHTTITWPGNSKTLKINKSVSSLSLTGLSTPCFWCLPIQLSAELLWSDTWTTKVLISHLPSMSAGKHCRRRYDCCLGYNTWFCMDLEWLASVDYWN